MKRVLALLGATAGLLLALAPVAWASNGVTLIRQSTTSLGCASPEPGYFLTICQPGSYELSSNIATSSGGLYIATGGVTLNLNGFTLASTDSEGAAILLAGVSGAPGTAPGVTIRGGAINGAFAGIATTIPQSGSIIPYGGFVTVRDVTVTGAAYGIYLPGVEADLDHITVMSADPAYTLITVGAGSVENCSLTMGSDPAVSVDPALNIFTSFKGYGGGPAIVSGNEVDARAPFFELGGLSEGWVNLDDNTLAGNDAQNGFYAWGGSPPSAAVIDDQNYLYGTIPPVWGSVDTNVCGDTGTRC